MDSEGNEGKMARQDLIDPDSAPTVNRILEEVIALHERLDGLPLREQTPCLIPVKEVARRLGVSTRHVETLIAERLIIPIWIGGTRRFDPRSVDAFINSAAKRRPRKAASGVK